MQSVSHLRDFPDVAPRISPTQPVVSHMDQAAGYPELRYMGSKHRLLPWIHGVLSELDFETAADPFVGSGCVAYLLKAMGKRVVASDFLNFPVVLATATIANGRHRLDGHAIKQLLTPVERWTGFHRKDV